MEYSTTGSPDILNALHMSIDPNKELFEPSSSGPPPPMPASAPPQAPSVVSDNDYEDDEREIEGGIGGGGEGGTLHLSVTDPQQIGEGRSAHTFYRIDVRRGGQYSDPIASVRRRYSDFQWLFQRLHAERPGAIVPIIPHTQAVQMSKRLSEELVEERRVYLEAFLRKVQIHPELEGAPSLAAFFSPDAEVFEAAKKANPGSATDEVAALDGDISATEKAKEKAKHFLVKVGIKAKSARGHALEEPQDTAHKMEEVEHYLSTLETHVKALSKATQYLVNSSKDTSNTMHELGQSLFGLHQTYDPTSASRDEVDQTPPQKSNLPTMKVISNVFACLSAVNKVKYDESQSKVGRPMLDIEWSIKAARLALKRRKARQIDYNTYLQQIKNREGNLEKLTRSASLSPQPGTHDAKISEAQQYLDNSKLLASKAMEELNNVTARVFREMDRFKRAVDEELRGLYVKHARVQVDYSRQLDAEWGKLLLENGGAGGGSGGGAGGQRPETNETKKAEMMMI